MSNIQFPFTTEKGETILNEEWLVREIKEKCGDEIGWRMAKILLPDPAEERQYRSLVEMAQQIRSELSEVDSDLEDLIAELREKAREKI